MCIDWLHLREPSPEWRSPSELPRERQQINRVPLLKRPLADPMLLAVVELTKADCPPVRRLEPGPAIGSRAHMRAFDRLAPAAAHAAVMAPHPGAMARTASIDPLARR